MLSIFFLLFIISTHAPRTGSDDLFDATKRFSDYFNPRSPHGERQL